MELHLFAVAKLTLVLYYTLQPEKYFRGFPDVANRCFGPVRGGACQKPSTPGPGRGVLYCATPGAGSLINNQDLAPDGSGTQNRS